ncbi:alpha/beta hydrolase [Haloferula chungangensis]|uniref:Alpha/beta hydrolase n=1 Tax=Haloferula chungangensis TaxID=1048331 RepID=A0ABW2LAP1_9BACT
MKGILWILMMGALACGMTAQVAESGAQVDASGKKRIRLWPIDQVGGEANRLKQDSEDRGGGKITYRNIKDPNLTVYQVESDRPTPAVIYCPGGAYKQVSVLQSYIEWLNGMGITVFALNYTVPNDREAAFKDGQRAIRLVRHQASKWNIDPKQIGLIGNSAGGHLVSRLSQNYTTSAYPALDEADQESSQPQFVIVVSGAYYATESPGTELAEEFHHKHPVAPTLLVYAKDDHNHYPGGLAYARSLKAADVSVRMMSYDHGGHGMKGVNWFPKCRKWLKEVGLEVPEDK